MEDSKIFYKELINTTLDNETNKLNTSKHTYQYLDITTTSTTFRVQLLKNIINILLEENELEDLGVPKHLEEFVRVQVEPWAKSAINALHMIENKEYVIVNENGRNRIKIINENTGVTMHNMHLSDGQHQFLEIKHGLELTQENLVTVFMSNIEYLSRYSNVFYGMSGTIGSQVEKDLLKKQYGVNLFPCLHLKQKKL